MPVEGTLGVRTAVLIAQMEGLVTLLQNEAERVVDASDRLERAIDRSEKNYQINHPEEVSP